jgi:hypothetical protein
MYTGKFKKGDIVRLSDPKRKFEIVADIKNQITDADGNLRPTQDYLFVEIGKDFSNYLETDEEILQLVDKVQ